MFSFKSSQGPDFILIFCEIQIYYISQSANIKSKQGGDNKSAVHHL